MSANQRRLAAANAKRLRSTIVRVGDQPYSFLPQVRQPRLGAGPPIFWCVLGSSIAAGTYPPSGAPGGPLTGQTIYYISSGAYVALSGTYSVYNPRAATATSGKLAAVTPNGDGTYSVIDWDC